MNYSSLGRRLLAVGAAVVLAVSLAPATPASAASQRIAGSFFGMHDSDPASWPSASLGSIRLWDAGVSWREIETQRGVYDFTRLDAAINTARANGAHVLLVLGQTPRFHSTRPGRRATYGLGAASMPTKQSWKNYVYQVVRRYKGRGVDYQVWNEANVANYWQGSPKQMATLTKLAAKVVDRNDRSAKLVAPALATRLTGQRAWLRSYYAKRTGGKKVASYVDAVSLNLYPLPKEGPEKSMSLLASSVTMLRRAGVHKPIWNTEINYGLLGGGTAKNISRAKEAAYVGRTYLLNAANGVKRVYWYSWDVQALANTQLTFNSGGLTRAGVAYKVVHDWLVRSRVRDCDRDRRGTYTCTMTYSDGVKRVYWNPSRRATVTTVKSATQSVNMAGTTTRLKGGEKLRVKYSPVMVRSKR